MKKFNIFIFIFVLILFSCNKKAQKPEGEQTFDPSLASQLSTCSDTITIGENTLLLEATVWRDFMPGGPSDGSLLICMNQLRDINSTQISTDIIIKKQYIVLGNEVWSTELEKTSSSEEHILVCIARNGPKWDHGLYVNVICELERFGETFQVIAKSQRIEATF